MDIFIIGSGVMGVGISKLFLNMKKQVCLFTQSELEKSKVQTLLHASFKKNSAKFEVSLDEYFSNLQIVTNLEFANKANFILEAVTEDMETKKNVFRALSGFIPDGALVATNTSSLSVTELASHLPDARNFLGMHFFNPPTAMKLVELVRGMKTSDDAVARAVEIVGEVGKDPVFVEESPGFIVNRLLIPMINEAVGILSESLATRDDIDKAMVLGTNHPMGPLRLADLIGNDVILSVMETLHQETGDPKYRAHPLLRKYVRSNWLGRKTKRGFYEYD